MKPKQLTFSFDSLFRKLDIDKPVLYVLSTRLWQFISGPVTILLIARFFSPEIQGFYYTFASLLALQSFIELGFYLVIINFASHEWARLQLTPEGRIVGDSEALSRLVSLGRLVFKWYAVASVIFVFAVGFGGYIFFSLEPQQTINWEYPWFALVILTGLILWALPFNSLLEGCNQVAVINRFRLTQSLAGSLALWITMLLSGGLWASVAYSGVMLIRDVFLLRVRYRRFFEPFFQKPPIAEIHWRKEIWPMQWRLAVQGIVSYFMYSLFNPVIFHYHGAAVAGQMGMTMQVIMALQSLAQAWILTRIPQFGILIAQRKFEELDQMWFRSSIVSTLVLVIGGISIWAVVFCLKLYQTSFGERLLDPLPTALLVFATVLSQVVQCYAAYLRAHKREPLVLTGVVSSLLTGFLVWSLGSRFGPTGATAGYSAVLFLVTVPWISFIWHHSRKKWHSIDDKAMSLSLKRTVFSGG